jgi:2-C-methyl-D-erythritol 2,4-cyclodiphosphate synthase
MNRVGIGYDSHRLVAGRRLILGGVEIEYELGLDGHSDADVLTHVVMDALLGAAGLGDIGMHFPDTDPAWRGADSIELLDHVAGLVKKAGYSIVNIDATVIAQAPKLGAHRDAMRESLAKAIGIDSADVNVKFTTAEKMGALGRGEGIAAQAVACVSGS